MRKKKTKPKILRKLTFVLGLIIILGIAFTFLYPLGYRDYINKYSQKYNIDPFLVASIINVESKYNKDAISHKNARGLMQIAEQTGEWASRELDLEGYSQMTLHDPDTNIKIGVWYLSRLKKEFKGDINLILAAYNGGSGNVNKWLATEKYSKDGKNLDNIPFEETANYVKKVKFNYLVYKTAYKNRMFESDNKDLIYISLINKIRKYIKMKTVLLIQGRN